MSLMRIHMGGFGGQGILLIGKMLAHAAMLDEKEVTWMPAYGPEMRGGTANCTVCVDDKPITSPVVTKCDVLIVMNGPSLAKFENMLVPGGHLFVNTKLCPDPPKRDDIQIHYCDATAMSEAKYGSAKVANMIMLGAVLKVTGLSTFETMKEVFAESLTGDKAKLIPQNMEAMNLWSEDE